MDTRAFLKTLDYAILKPATAARELREAIGLCRAIGVECLCVRGRDVAAAAAGLAGCDTLTAAVVGFPHANTDRAIKASEALHATRDGAGEIDMVADLSALRDGQDQTVIDDIQAVVDASGGRPVKVILETALLTDAEIRRGVSCAIAAGAAFVKTSTGFAPQGGATPHAVRVMLDAAQGKIQVKASGGIRTRADAEAYLAMGCTRLGVGNVLALLSDEEKACLPGFPGTP